METEETRDVWSVSWRTRKADDLKSKAWKPGAAGESTKVSRPENQLQCSMSEHKRRCMSQLRQGEWIRTFSAFLFYSDPQGIRCSPPILLRAISFTQWTDSDRNPFWRRLTDMPRNDVLPVSWVFPSPVKLTHKSNHHRFELQYWLFLGLQPPGWAILQILDLR